MSLRKYKIKKPESISLVIFLLITLGVFSGILLLTFYQPLHQKQNKEAKTENLTDLINKTQSKLSNINETTTNTPANINTEIPAIIKATIAFSQPKHEASQGLEIDCLADAICSWQTLSRTLKETSPVTGISEVEDYAAGDITVHNDSSEALNLAIQSRLLSDSGILFRTQERKTIPAHSTTEVYCRADVKGAQGNIEPSHFTLVALPPISQKVYYGTTDKPMTGGLVTKGLITEEQVNQLENKLIDQFNTEYQDLKTENNDTTITKLESAAKITSTTVKPVVGTETSEFTLTLKLTKDYLLSDNLKLKQYLSDKKIAENYQVSELKIDLANNSVILTVTGQTTEEKQLDLEKLKADIAGKTKAEAEEYLTDLGLENISIEYQDDKLPNNSQQIEILLK